MHFNYNYVERLLWRYFENGLTDSDNIFKVVENYPSGF